MAVLIYSRQRVLLHWFSAVVILWTLLSGFYVSRDGVSASLKESIGFFNVSLTTVFIPFFVWRLSLFVSQARCSGLKSCSWNEVLALLTHVLIYLTVAAVLLTGVLMMDRPIDVFGVITIAQPLSDPHLIALSFTAHVWACLLLALLIALHVGAVIFHESCNHQVLRRMSLWRCGKQSESQQ
ncbi:cytochrome b [Pseudomonas vancouverensis]|uniref:cytochrome b n=1 Tax=Pseudomonas vancouverensis TaxID=95300 RepID=UPI003D00618C